MNRADAQQKLEQLLREFWVQDDRFGDRFALQPVFGPGVHMRRLRYYLQELETFYSANASSDLRFNADNSSIDQVMPDTLSEVWRRDLAEKNADQLHLQHESLGDTIGNLTVLLIPDNSKVTNLSFTEKKQVYLHPEETLPKLGFRRRHPIPACTLKRIFPKRREMGVCRYSETRTRFGYSSSLHMESRYRHPVTLALAEKIFGPSLNGKGTPGNTLSAMATPGKKGKTYIGVPGIEPDAVFYIRFPRELDLSRLPRTRSQERATGRTGERANRRLPRSG